MGKYTLMNVQENLEAVVRATKEENIPPSLTLQASHTLWIWAEAHNMIDRITSSKDAELIEPFWGLCESYGIQLSDKEKNEIFENFLED